MPDELMYLLVHHLDGALAGSPQTEAPADKPLLHSTLTWQVRACRSFRIEAPTHLQVTRRMLVCKSLLLLDFKHRDD
jgi:hypothetical protein